MLSKPESSKLTLIAQRTKRSVYAYALRGIIIISAMELVIASPLFQFQFQPHTRRSASQISSKHGFPCRLKCHFDEKRNAGEQADKTAIQRICEKLMNAGYIDEVDSKPPELGPGSAGEIFLPNPKQLAKYKVGHTLDGNWSKPQYPIPEAGQGSSPPSTIIDKDTPKLPTLAEMTIPPEELKRLRTLAIRTEKKLKIGKAGITDGIVDSIHERWRNSEIVKIKCEDFCRWNMRRTHDILEMKTGGLVVWRAGSVIVIYRGINYEPPYVKAARSLGIALKPVADMPYAADRGSLSTPVDKVGRTLSGDTLNKDSLADMMDGKQLTSFVNSDVALNETDCTSHPIKIEYEREINNLLEGLGPRFTDWWGYDPLPVDADLLPPVVLGYKKPFRLLPYGMKLKLTDSEMTILRRLARPLPPHFALGINKHLQGLAAAIVKLWDRSEVAKIALKRGVQNTDSEKMAEELKWLTGGSLLSRDEEFIVFYRGKDFIPSSVATVLAERKAMIEELEEKEGKTQLIATSLVLSAGETATSDSSRVAQIPEAKKPWEKWIDSEEQRKIKAEALTAKRLAVARRLHSKLTNALSKKSKVENELGDIEKAWEPAEMPADRETITEEERFMLRKLGLRMKPFLLLGRRGVFDGVVENMHLHWKYRELVKIISKEKSVPQVKRTARLLEYESGGILVAVESVSKGHAIIIYRGKNYRRPAVLRPKSLLTKKEALKHSIEIQRHESLNLQILRLERNIELLKNHLNKVEDENEEISELLIDELESTSSEDEDEITLQSTEGASSANPSKDEEETTLYSTEELGSVYHPEKDEDEGEAVQFDSCDSNSENEASVSNCQSGKNAAQSISDDSGTVDYHTTKNKMPDNVYRAKPLSNKQRLLLRKQALKWGKPAQFHVGKNNVVHGLVKSIRSYFEKHALVIVGVKGRSRGTPIAEIVFQLKEATGAVLVSQEPTKIILYRGWPEAEEKFSYKKAGEESEEMSTELLTAIRKECGLKAQDDTENIQNDSNHKVHADNEILQKMAEEDCQLAMNFQG